VKQTNLEFSKLLDTVKLKKTVDSQKKGCTLTEKTNKLGNKEQ